MKRQHDAFYASLPRVAFKECLDYQLRSNEEPFYPPFTDGVGPTLGKLFRKQTDAFGLTTRAESESTGANANAVLIPEAGRFGARYASPEEIVASARELKDEELGLRTTQVRDFYGEL